ncbi:MAG: hypothetical protein KBC12_03465 [Candidatus Pacebacteria bacterium]|nr:hypothetical protein [Candidatus Paceibacterota bacterium]MBP9851314.1 hypothetical protein [Candidatus Paceibacterota bacterium]
MEPNFSVQFEDFTERYFIKSFAKKYKNNWELTRRAIIEMLERIDSLLLTDKAETITDIGNIKIIKTKFRVFGTNESAKTSGNRCIVSADYTKREVRVLLVYGKTDLSGHNETAEWQKIIKTNYPEYKHLF